MNKQPTWIAKQIHKIDKMDYSFPQAEQSIAIPDDTIWKVNLLREQRHISVNVVAQSYTFTVPASRYWLVSGLTAMNLTGGRNQFYSNIKKDAVQFTTIPNGSTVQNISSNCLEGLQLPILFTPGETIQVYNHNYQALDTIRIMIRYAEIQMMEA